MKKYELLFIGVIITLVVELAVLGAGYLYLTNRVLDNRKEIDTKTQEIKDSVSAIPDAVLQKLNDTYNINVQ